MEPLPEAAFCDDPGAWADPAQAGALLAPGLHAGTARRLFASPRTGARASALLAGLLGHGKFGALDPVDRGLALAPLDDLRTVGGTAGAICQAAGVSRLLRATEIAAFAARHGAWARAMALRHAHRAPPGDAPAADGLDDAVARDGLRCLAAWIATLPPWAGARLRLRWPAGALPDAAALGDTAWQAQAAGIVRTVALERPGA